MAALRSLECFPYWAVVRPDVIPTTGRALVHSTMEFRNEEIYSNPSDVNKWLFSVK